MRFWRSAVVNLLIILLVAAATFLMVVRMTGGPVHGATPGTPGPLPRITDSQRAKAVALVRADPTVSRLTKGHSFTVLGTLTWLRRTGQVMGAVVTLGFSPPAHLAGQAIALDWDCSERNNPPYGALRYVADLHHVSRMDVFVDLGRHRIAGMEPDPGTAFRGKVQYLTSKTYLSDSCEGE